MLDWVQILRYLVLLRVPLLVALLLIVLPYAAVFTSARSLLGGLFDLTPRGFFFANLAAIAAGWAVLFTSRLIVSAAHDRFLDVAAMRLPGTLPQWAVAFGLLAAPTMAAGLWMSPRRDLGRRGLAVLAAGITMTGLFAGGWKLFSILGSTLRAGVEPWLNPWAEANPEVFRGYTGRDLDDHLTAALAFSVAFLLYIVLGIVNRRRLGGGSVPALTSALQLLILLGWGFAGLTFFFDAFRVPVFLVAGAWFAAMAQSPASDHYYRIAHRTEPRPAPPTPAETLRAKGRERVIVVAANGGGIQAAAWTARVLTGLCADLPGRFAPAVRFISAVSGGSVGAMHFVNAYGRPEAFEGVLDRAMESSLDDIAWGLVYPDFWRLFCPPLVKWWSMGRGRALEEAWERRDPGVAASLAAWEEEVRAGGRPAVAFNATLAEKGVRLLASTAPLEESQGVKESHRARLNFQTLYRDHDIAVSTAVRLSATFPYVSPATRADVPGPQPHVVDGGYFDNFGMSTLVEWLDAAVAGCSDQVKEILILQIRGTKVPDATARTVKQVALRGWFYQAFAPLETMLSVRGAGQVSHNEMQYGLLQRAWEGKVNLRSVVLEFPGDDPPLSWHLTAAQKQDILEAWEAPSVRACREQICEFLSGSLDEGPA
jgi:hypothetical protein